MLIPDILPDGAGTRLWPLYREAHPKLFMKREDVQNLPHNTSRGAAVAASGSEIFTVINCDHYFFKDEVAGDGIGVGHHGVYLLEPTGRNTAPAVALAAHPPPPCQQVWPRYPHARAGILELVMIEAQRGEYLVEDDIVRFQNHYRRA